MYTVWLGVRARVCTCVFLSRFWAATICSLLSTCLVLLAMRWVASVSCCLPVLLLPYFARYPPPPPTPHSVIFIHAASLRNFFDEWRFDEWCFPAPYSESITRFSCVNVFPTLYSPSYYKKSVFSFDSFS